ncbi:hypothetical protein [Rhodococcus sp. IEGM 1379]|uniref:hypothetical protein n=1 Tax=Rhodococcus sp. IEGM 1379 TaxID=3047086 RepID=UPI0024B7BA38|nr:hypothetical protein [Rhodococcus sp. IEGM 1379]MDI9918652.1 hypothetical protein [Rhodococcus sp. IEGM 1379]
MIRPDGRDVRDLLGMHSAAARAMAALFALTCAISLLYTSSDVSAVWPLWLAALVCSASAFTLVLSDGDPLPLVQSIALSLTGAVSSAAVLSVVPVPVNDQAQLWQFGMSTAVFTFMCVRGRTGLAWFGLVLMIATAMIWSTVTEQGSLLGLSMTAINAGPVLMSTFFAYTIRPQAKVIYQLREQSTARIAAESAASAALAERDEQLNRLDRLARPLLERVASGIPLSPAERQDCELLEAKLRDSLRAPGLQKTSVVDAVHAARSRGVEVVMLDDHGMDDADPEVRECLHRAVVDELATITSGTVTIRILPPRRTAMATMLIDAEDVRRLEFDHSGERIVRAAAI